MPAKLEHSLLIFPVPDLQKTSGYYVSMLGFRAVPYMQVSHPHICLYRDAVEIVLVQSKASHVKPNRVEHGCYYDGYFTLHDVQGLYDELVAKKVSMAKQLGMTDYGNWEFVVEDPDGRWICFGAKQ
jgi:hypothetical protein